MIENKKKTYLRAMIEIVALSRVDMLEASGNTDGGDDSTGFNKDWL